MFKKLLTLILDKLEAWVSVPKNGKCPICKAEQTQKLPLCDNCGMPLNWDKVRK